MLSRSVCGTLIRLIVTTSVALVSTSVLVTTSKAPVTTSVALVPSCFIRCPQKHFIDDFETLLVASKEPQFAV